jgi:hypothetical protein
MVFIAETDLCDLPQALSLKLILFWTPETSIGSPSTTRGLYLNFSAASTAACSKIGDSAR